MGKRFIITFVFLTLFRITYGQSISPIEASVVAQNYYNTYNLNVIDSGFHVPVADKMVSSVVHWNKADSTYLYFVNMQGGGWVLVANEQRYTPILGFSATDSVALSDTLNMPPALRCLLNDYTSVIDSIRQNNDIPSIIVQTKWSRLKTIGIDKDSIKITYQRNISQNYDSYSGSYLLGNNMWGQDSTNIHNYTYCEKFYNKFCPDFFNVTCGRTVVGCTAVAMAQVMRYWRWPDYANIAPTIDMCGTTYGTSVPHYYDWDCMPNMITNNADMYQVDMIAGLLRDCGYAAHMIYSGGGSAAVLSYAQYALHDIFKYNNADIVNKIGKSDEEWGNLMRTEINLGRPVICQATSYKNGISIHTFVVDGYHRNNPELFHINFGWRGSYINQWFDLTNFNAYHYGRSILTNLFPDCSTRIAFEDLPYDQIYSGDFKRQYAISNIGVSNLTINTGGQLKLDAGTQIVLSPEFTASLGCLFQANIKNFVCDGMQQRIAECNPTSQKTLISSQSSNIINIPAKYLNVYPNPATNEIVITSSEMIQNVQLYSINGQKLLQVQTNTLQIGYLPQGIYILKVYTETGVTHTKIIKQ